MLTHCGTYFMVTIMKCVGHDKRRRIPLPPLGIICLALMVAMLAHPVLAAVSASMNCNGQCGCCAKSDPAPILSIRSGIDMRAGCCGPAASAPCRMSAVSLPEASPALIRTAQKAPGDAIQLPPSGSSATVSIQPCRRPVSTIGNGTTLPTPALYLQSCRLIC